MAVIALVLIAVSRPSTVHRPARMDYRGLALIVTGIGLSVFGFQQASTWGWSNPAIGLCIAVGVAVLVVFALVELRTDEPLMQVRIFAVRPFLVENMVLGIAMLAFVPVFFFASEYAQVSLAKSASGAGLFLLYFFLGFVVAAQIGGRMLDRTGAKRPVVIGCVLAAVGFGLWAGKVTTLSFSAQQWYVVVAGAGMGFLLGPASTDAVNRASRLSYGEATGITQTVRNYAASLGLAILGTLLVTEMRSRLATSLVAMGTPPARAASEAATLAEGRAVASSAHGVATVPHVFELDFAYATRSVLYAMAVVMAVAAVVAVVGLRRGVQEEPVEDDPVADGGSPSPPLDPVPSTTPPG